jgi:hypothetical protein
MSWSCGENFISNPSFQENVSTDLCSYLSEMYSQNMNLKTLRDLLQGEDNEKRQID